MSSSSSSSSPPLLVGGLELGGTTIKVCIAEGHATNVIHQTYFPTQTPQVTLQHALNYFRGYKIHALGIGSFGPVDLDTRSPTYGYITSTPKLAWQNADVVGVFKSLGVPIAFNTDVNGVALAEMLHGQHGDVRNVVYVTVGTGVGAGIVVDGRAVSGALHPEAGHFRVPRHPQDTYEGNCPFHKDCIEGLSNAAAVAARCGVHPSQLASVPDTCPAWDIEAHYLAELCVALATIVSPHVIVLGGGVLKRTCLYEKTRAAFRAKLNGYLRVPRMTEHVDKYIVPSIFERASSKTSAGCVGALELAFHALTQHAKL